MVDHLRQCTKVEALCRPAVTGVGAPSPGPPAIPLPSLQRLEWCCSLSLDRLGGIHSLEDVLLQCPNLRYLFLTGTWEAFPLSQTSVNMPKLETLRLGRLSPGFIDRMLGSEWSLPALKTIILDQAPTSYVQQPVPTLFWNKFGKNVTRVELGKESWFSEDNCISVCLAGCPALQELSYHPFYIYHRTWRKETHRSLRCLRLHASADEANDEEELWDMLLGHLYTFNHRGMKRLSNMVLHGDWTRFMNDAQWGYVEDIVEEQGREIDLEM